MEIKISLKPTSVGLSSRCSRGLGRGADPLAQPVSMGSVLEISMLSDSSTDFFSFCLSSESKINVVLQHFIFCSLSLHLPGNVSALEPLSANVAP